MGGGKRKEGNREKTEREGGKGRERARERVVIKNTF